MQPLSALCGCLLLLGLTLHDCALVVKTRRPFDPVAAVGFDLVR